MKTTFTQSRAFRTSAVLSVALLLSLSGIHEAAASDSMLCPLNWGRSTQAAPAPVMAPAFTPGAQTYAAPVVSQTSYYTPQYGSAFQVPVNPSGRGVISTTSYYTTDVANANLANYGYAVQQCFKPEISYQWRYSRIPRTNFVTFDVSDGCGGTRPVSQPVVTKSILPWLHREAVVKNVATPCNTGQSCYTPSACGTSSCSTSCSSCTDGAAFTQSIGSSSSDCSTCTGGSSLSAPVVIPQASTTFAAPLYTPSAGPSTPAPQNTPAPIITTPPPAPSMTPAPPVSSPTTRTVPNLVAPELGRTALKPVMPKPQTLARLTPVIRTETSRSTSRTPVMTAGQRTVTWQKLMNQSSQND